VTGPALTKLWSLTERLLVVVEPGTMAGFRRVLDYRTSLIAQGATIVAPCSHDLACPLAGNERWCHFAARLPRTRDHIVAKGAAVPFEDEKFIYFAALKDAPAPERGQRVLATPKVSKAAIALTLCAPDVAEQRSIARRDNDAYRKAKRLDWGDMF
jgi:ribosomal protein RSM22 (predicted rRNA methylase)